MSADPPRPTALLVAVFASPVSAFLLRYGADLGFRTLLVEPDAARVPAGQAGGRGASPNWTTSWPAGPRTSSSPTTTGTSWASCCATRWPGPPAGSASWATRGTRGRTSRR